MLPLDALISRMTAAWSTGRSSIPLKFTGTFAVSMLVISQAYDVLTPETLGLTDAGTE